MRPLLGLVGVELPEPVEVGEFGAYAAEIVPARAEDCFDLGGGLFREGRFEVFARDALFRQQRADFAHDPAGEIGRSVGIGAAQALEQADRQRAGNRVAGALCAAARPPDHAPKRIGHQKLHDDFAEDLPAFEPRQALLEIGQREFTVDDRRHAGRNLRQAVADIAHRGAERAENLILLLEQLHQIDGDARARGRAAGDQPPAALEAEQRGVEAFAADVLEHHVDALLGGELAHHALEALGLVVDDVIGADRLGFFRLGVVADRGDDGAADAPSPS